jgi:hypothetical protein
MHEILGDLRGFTGIFDAVVANMTDLSRGIVEHVKGCTLVSDSRSRVSGNRKSRQNSGPGISTTGRTADACTTRGLLYQT